MAEFKESDLEVARVGGAKWAESVWSKTPGRWDRFNPEDARQWINVAQLAPGSADDPDVMAGLVQEWQPSR